MKHEMTAREMFSNMCDLCEIFNDSIEDGLSVNVSIMKEILTTIKGYSDKLKAKEVLSQYDPGEHDGVLEVLRKVDQFVSVNSTVLSEYEEREWAANRLGII